MRSALRFALPLLLLVAFAGRAATDVTAATRIPLDSYPKATLQISSGGSTQQFQVWVADTSEQRQQGLMFVKHVEPLHGMLFIFGQPQPVVMWMKNTLIPLDMLFVAANGRIVHIAPRTRPKSLEAIYSMGMVTGVIEIAGGEAKRLGIHTGDRVIHPAFKPE